MVVDDDGVAADPHAPVADVAGRAYGPDDVFLINSTSGTTGMPKCVVHTENRWMYFHQLAVDAGDMTGDDVFLSAIPAPFGFGIWTAHVTPAVLGAPTVVHERFDADEVIRTIERERVTVLACVSTQFLLMLKSPIVEQHDLSSLRCMFTGGEAVPEARAARFEDVTGARVLQFYGSNETGALSRTTMRDDRDHRLQTAGRLIVDMHVRLLDDDGRRHHDPRHTRPSRLQGAGHVPRLPRRRRAPTTSCSPPTVGCASATCARSTPTATSASSAARPTSSSGAARTSAHPRSRRRSREHPDVARRGRGGDARRGVRRAGVRLRRARTGTDLDLDALVTFLRDRGISPEWFPERLVVVDALPRASGRQGRQGRAARRHPSSPRRGSMTAMKFAPLPPTAAWRHVEAQDGFETVFLRDVASGHVIDGHTAAIEDGEVWAVHYTVEVDERWLTQHCRVWSWSRTANARPSSVGTRPVGGESTESSRPSSTAASTSTSKRPPAPTCSRSAVPDCALHTSMEVPAAYVRTPDLAVERLEQSYFRLSSDNDDLLFEYRSPRFGFEDELRFGPDGLVLDYPGIATRVV